MYNQDLNTTGGRITFMAMAAAKDYGYVYKGRHEGIHTFARDTSHGEMVLRCTDRDIRDHTLPVMLERNLSR